MRCLFTMIITLLGIASLAAGGFLLYTSFVDTPDTRVDTLGGASQTQRTVAVESTESGGQIDLPVVIDGGEQRANNIGTVELSQADVDDLTSALDSAENAAVQDVGVVEEGLQTEISSQAAIADADIVDASRLDTNVVLENEVLNLDTQVEVRSINVTTSSDGGGRREESAGQGGSGGVGATIEQRVVEFEWPEEFRTGEAGSIRLTLKALPSGGLEVSSAEIPTNAVIATPVLMTDCYDAYDATVTATIIAPSFEVEETGEASQPLTRGSEVTWRWSLSADKEGTYIITMAINLDWQPKIGVPQESPLCSALAQSPFSLWGQSVQVDVNRVLGLITIQQASVAGTVLAVVGFIAELPFMGEIFSVLFERRLEKRADRKRQKQAEKDARRRRR